MKATKQRIINYCKRKYGKQLNKNEFELLINYLWSWVHSHKNKKILKDYNKSWSLIRK